MPGIFFAAAGAALIGYALFSPYRVVVGFRNGKPFPLTVRSVGRLENGDRAWLSLPAADAFESMRNSAFLDGVELRISSAFRSWEEQVGAYTRWILRISKFVAAKPGWSNHQQGTTVDLDVNGGTNAAYRWMMANGSSWGWCRTVHCEAHHFEFLGVGCSGYRDITTC